MKETVSIIIPVYNEEKNIPMLLEKIDKVRAGLGRDMEVVMVDDGSQDRSFEVMKECKELLKGIAIRLIRFKRNFGQTAAIVAGIDNAKGGIVVTMDADLQNDPEDISALLSAIGEGYDVVSGWRKDRKDAFFTRKLPSNLANRLISWYTGVSLHDYGCTLKAYRKETFDGINLYGELHRFIPALMSWTGARIKEIPVRHHSRKFGKSKYGISRTLNVILDLVTVRFLLSSSKGPMQIFGRMGLFLCFGGFASGVATVIMRLTINMNMTGNPLLYLSIFLMIIGLQFMSLGLLGELNMRTYHRSHKRKIYVIDDMV
ncbi:MAG: glycosyltransferase family 2 protein [Candidatus Omnitrophota bacterium]